MECYDLLILGGGPAGMTAAVYASRAMLRFAVLEQAAMSGGQMMNTNEIDNYPGCPSTDGYTLAMQMRKQAEDLGTVFLSAGVQRMVQREGKWQVLCDRGEYFAKTVIIATGARHRKLNVDGEERLTGRGVSYCATCDGAFFRNRTVAVVGGGNTAAEEALYLAGLCEKVYLIHRRDTLRAGGALTKRVLENPKIQPVWNAQVLAIEGQNRVSGVLLNTEQTLAVDGVFVAVGIRPNSEPFLDLADSDERGFLRADETGQTSAPGVFAAGDVRTKNLRQIITAAADGANAVAAAERYLQR